MKLHRPKDKNMYLMTLGSLRPTLREYDSITGLGRILLRNSLLTGKATVVSSIVIPFFFPPLFSREDVFSHAEVRAQHLNAVWSFCFFFNTDHFRNPRSFSSNLAYPLPPLPGIPTTFTRSPIPGFGILNRGLGISF